MESASSVRMKMRTERMVVQGMNQVFDIVPAGEVPELEQQATRGNITNTLLAARQKSVHDQAGWLVSRPF
jgi:hypothetical protein